MLYDQSSPSIVVDAHAGISHEPPLIPILRSPASVIGAVRIAFAMQTGYVTALIAVITLSKFDPHSLLS